MPLSSMTGFARADGETGDYRWTWEIRSVNGRNLDLRFRLPGGFEAIEPGARRLAGEKLGRGSLSCNLQISRTGEQATYRVNHTLLQQLAGIVTEAGRTVVAEPARLDGLLALRGVIEIDEPEETEAERGVRNDAVLTSLAGALDELVAMRDEEGARLAAIVAGQLDEVEKLTEQAKALAAAQPEALRQRLAAAVGELLAGGQALPEDRLAQEVAILAAKADIREELDRLTAHVASARALIEGGGTDGKAGRRLDFMAQELNREANTLCSKSQDVELTRLGLELKVAVDRIREQVQNIE